MKVLHLLDVSRPNVSGYSSRSDAIIRSTRDLGVETCHITSQKYDKFVDKEEIIDGIKFYRTTKAKGIFTGIPLLSYVDYVRHMSQRVKEVVDIENPDIIHAHSPMLNGLVALKVGKETGIPVMYEVRAFWEDAAVDTGKIKEFGFQYKIIRSIEQYVFNKADRIACICEGLRKEIISRGISASKLITVPNAVNLDKFQPIKEVNIELKRKLGLEDKVVLAFLGSFFKYEGLEFLIKSLPLIQSRIGKKVHILLVGGGNEEDNLKRLASELGVGESVTFTGRVNYNEINDYYSLVDLLVFPRETIRLTELVTPLKPLEAMAQGIPLIASNIGGHRELIEDDVTGGLFDPESPEALADKVVELLLDSNKLKRYVENGLSYVRNERRWDKTAQRYLPVYESMC